MIGSVTRRRGPGGFDRTVRVATAIALAIMPVAAQAQQLPAGGVVAAGSASIGTPSNGTLNINQSSNRAVINWNSFSVGQGGTVNFNQPGASSATLNRVTGATPSSIAGTINAPGTVLLVNPNGIAISKTGVVNVGSFAASTLGIKDADFMSGNYKFTGSGASASVTNAGRINVSDGGFAALLGGRVANDGIITARLGRVGLGSGELITLDLSGDGFLSVGVPTKALGSITDGTGRALVSNRGKIVADGGIVHLSAATAAGILRDAVNVPGSIRANSVGTSNGRIVIGGGAGGRVQVSGRVRANGGKTGDGGTVAVSGAAVAVAGKISANGRKGGTVTVAGNQSADIWGSISAKATTGTGGTVIVTARDIKLASEAVLDASGATGGTVLVGGDYQGGANAANNFVSYPILNAFTTVVAAGAQIRADGSRGNGGKVVVWSDDQTSFAGAIGATGTGSGQGGFAEVSGHRLLDFTGTADLKGPGGFGTLLLDPRNVTISSSTGSGGALASGTFTPSADNSILNVATLQTALASGNVVVTTGSTGSQSGDITVANAVTWASGSSLTLSAYRNIAVNANLTGTGGGAVILRADNSGTGTGSVSFGAGNTISTSGAVSIYYNPTGDSTTVNASKYTSATQTSFTGNVAGGASLTSYMLVNTAFDLQNIQNNLSGRYVLGRDIDASATASWNSGAGFAPIGTWSSQFTGSLDGQNHAIDGLVINRSGVDYVGLFSYADPISIGNLVLSNVSVIGGGTVGALVGNMNGDIDNVIVSGQVTGSYAVGGIVGSQIRTLSNSTSAATVTGTSMVGGLVGEADTIHHSSATGNVVATTGNAGGLAGTLRYQLADSYATGSVTGVNAGGLVGSVTTTGVRIGRSWSSGVVSGSTNAGGLVGTVTQTLLIGASYWDTTTTGMTNAIGSAPGAVTGATGLTSTQARTQSSYSGFDFADTWYMVDGSTRPFLRSEYSTTIRNAHQLQLAGMNTTTLAASYSLANDIALGTTLTNASEMWSSAGFAPIGNSTTPFTGTFNGNSHTISGLIINRPTTQYVGLFGYVGTSAAVSNLGVTGTVTGQDVVGMLAGRVEGTLSNVYATGTLSGGYQVGGLAGVLDTSGTISLSHANVAVTGAHDDIGGLVGQSAGAISQSYASGSVVVSNSAGNFSGGLVGHMNAGSITQSFATGAVDGGGLAGGLVGSMDAGTITQAYATGSVNAKGARSGGLLGAYVGGTVSEVYATGYGTGGSGNLFGLVPSGTSLTNGYWDTQTSGLASNVNGTGTAKTTAQLQAALPSGFNTSVWGIVAGQSYPFFLWQYPSAGGAPQVISGTAYANFNLTAAAGATVSGLVNGVGVGSTTAGANGYFNLLLAPNAIASNSQVAVYTTGAIAGLSYYQDRSGSLSGVGLYASNLNETSSATTMSAISSGLATAIGSSGVATTYASRSLDLYGGTFSIDQAITQSSALRLVASANVTQTAGSAIVANTFFVSSGSGSVTLTDSGNQFSTLGSASVNFGSLSIYDSVSLSVGYVYAGGPISIRTAGALSLASTMTSAASGNAIVLAAGTTFSSPLQGSGALSLTGGGRFLIYSQDPANDNVGGLTGGKIYSSTYAANPPGSISATGNQFIYASASPLTQLTYTVANASSTYGTLATLGAVTLSGNPSGVTGVVSLYDSGNNLVTLSAALAAGTYTEKVTSLSGANAAQYQIASSGNTIGTLIIGKASLTVTAANASKTYDGVAYSGGNGVSYAGLVNGETSAVLGGTLSYGGTAQGAKNAGSYTLTASGLTSSNYTIAYTAGALTVGKAALSVTAANASKTYDGLAYSGGNGVSYSGFVNGETSAVLGGTLGYGGSAQGAKNAGSYTLTGSGLTSSNYTIAYTAGSLTIGKANLTVTASDATKTYDGLAFSGGNGVSYTGLVNGETSAVLGGTLAYGGSAQGAKNAGSYALTASGLTSSNYTIAYNAGALTIGKAALTVTASDASKTYDGLAFSGGNGVSYAGLVNGETSAVLGGTLGYGGSAQGAKNAGNYALTASGLSSSNYTIAYTAGALSIGKAALTVTASDAGKTYDGLAFSGGNGVSYAGLVNGETSAVLGGALAYGGAAQGAINAGSYALTASGLTSSNYTIAYNAGALNIGKAALTVTAGDASKTYDGLAFSGGNGVSYAGLVNGETSAVLGGTLAYGGTAQGAINAGSYTLAASGLTSSNYTIAYNAGALSVGKAPLTVTASAASKTYDGLAFSGGNGVAYSGLVNGETSAVLGGTLAYGGTAQGATNAGSYSLTASGLSSSNYTIAYSAGALTVNKANLTVTATDASKTYDGLAFSGGNGVRYAGLVNGETSAVLGGTLAYGGTAQGATNAGNYTLAASGLTSSNYTIAYNAGALNIGKAALTVTASDASKTYDGLAFSGGNGVSYSGLVNGETSAVLGGTLAYGGTAQGAKNAGSYTLAASGLSSSNYNIAYTAGALNIGKAALTVTASDASKTYDGLAFGGGNGVSYSGFVNGETSAVLGGTLAYGGTAQGAINAGSYALTASGLASSNYNIAYAAGALSIGKAALTVTASDASKTYDGLAFSGGNGVSYAGLVNGETAAVLGGTLSYGGTAQGATNAGSYALAVSGLTSSNYTIAYNAGALTIGKAALTVTASDASKTYDGLAFSGGNGVSYSGLVNGETSAVLGGTLAYGGAAQGAINAGSYTLAASGLTSSNYNIAYSAGALTVNKAALTVTASDASKTYDGLAFSGGNGVSYAGFVNGETAAVLGGTLAYGGAAQGATNAGSYTLAASGLTSSNYNIAYSTGALTVNKAALTVTASDASKTYDGLAFSGGNGVSYAGLVNGETSAVLGGTLTYGGTAQGARNAGSYTLAASGLTSSNYTIAYNAGSLTVNKANLVVTANDVGKTYGTTLTFAGTEFSTQGLVSGDGVSAVTLASAGAANSANVGQYAITASNAVGSGLSNYNISYLGGTLNVATATLLVVTANDASKTYGTTLSFSGSAFSTQGLTNGDSVSAVTLASAGAASSAGVGQYAIIASNAVGSGLSNYSINYAPGTLVVNPAALTVTAANASKTYDGLAYSGGNGVSYSGFVNGETSAVLGGTLAYGGAAQGATNAGSYALTASGLASSNYNIVYSAGVLTVNKANLTVTASDASKTYNGLAFNGGNGVSYAGLVNGETSAVLGGTLAYGGAAQGAINAGSYTLAASGLTSSNYNIAYSAGALTVNKAALTVTASDAGKTYDGLAFNGGNGVSYAGLVNGETAAVLGGTLAYGGTAQGATNAGSYSLTASGLTSSNYTIAYNAGALNIGKAALTVTANNASKTYDGLAFSGGNGVSYAGLVNGETSAVLGGTLAYGGAAQGAINAGGYALTASGLTSSNYTIAYTAGALNIGKAALTVTASDASKTYDGLAFSGGNGVSYSSFVNGETSAVLGGTLAYGGTAQGATNAGGYALTASGLASSNYNIAYAAGALSIGKANLTVTASNASKTYDGLAFSGGNGVSYSGLVNGETSAVLGGTLGYGGTAQGAKDAGSYSLTASGLTSSNYTIAYNAGSLTVGKASLIYVADSASRVYGNANATLTGTITGFVNGETVATATTGAAVWSTSATASSNVGSYAVTGSGLSAANYTFGQAVSNATALTVTPAATLVYVADGTSRTYGSSNPVLTGVVIGFVNGDTLASATTGTIAWTSAATQSSSAGSYAIVGSGLVASNYSFVQAGGNGTALTINKANLTVTASDASKTYDGLAFSGGNGVSYSGLVNGETSAVLGGTLAYGGAAQGATNAGSYTLAASGLTSSNYNIAYSAGALTVNKANLTVTASAASKTYDGLAFSGGNGVSYAGLVNGETSAVLGGTLAYGGSAQGATNAGSYALTASGLTSSNYTIAYAAGALSIGKAALTVTASDASKTYDGLAFSGGNGVSYAGLVNGETSSVLGGTLAYGGTAQGATNAGGYSLTASGLSSSNYTIAYSAGALTVNKANLTVTASDASKTYDGLAFSGGNGVSYAGLVNGETSAVLGGTLAYGGAAQGATNAGSYALTASGLASSNYNIAYAAGALTVNKANLTVTASDAGKTYDGLAFSGGNGVTYAGLVNGETSSALGGTLSYGGSAQGARNAGSYALTASGLTSSNYTIAYNAGALTVNKAALTVTADAQSKQVGDTDPSLTYVVTTGKLFGADALAGALTRAAGESVGNYLIQQGALAASANYDLSFIGADLSIVAAPNTTSTTTDAGLAASRYVASANGATQPLVNISFRTAANTATPVVQSIGGTTPAVRSAATPVTTATPQTTTVADITADQDIAPGAGPGLVFLPISQFDKSQYSQDTLPAFAPKAAETTIATMVARALGNTPGVPKVDRLWRDESADWAKVEGVSLTDERGAARSAAEAQGFANGTVDVAAMLARGPVMFGGVKSDDAPRPWLLAIHMTVDGKGIVANDPGTGRQVILGYDPVTRTVGEVTSVIDPRSQQPVALGNDRPDLGPDVVQVPLQAWTDLKTFKPTSFVEVAIKR